ncbi:MAG: ATP-binding cassette domain-containing protein [Planctomycetota bacterium]
MAALHGATPRDRKPRRPVDVATLALKTESAHLLFQSGRMEVLIGPPASGKSRLLRLLAGLATQADARVYAGGVEVTGSTPLQRGVRYVAPGGVVYPGCSVLDNLLLAAGSADPEGRARRAAHEFGLDDVLHAPADRLPPAVRQRVAFAKASSSTASAVLLDEPFAAFDSLAHNSVRELLRTAFVARERIVAVATGSPIEAAGLGGGLHVVDDRAVLQRGALRSIMAAPASERVARIVFGPGLSVWPVMLVKDVTLGRLVQLGDRLVVPAPTAWDALPPGSYRLGIPAHRVRLARRHAADVELRAEVARVDAAGGQLLVTVRTERREIAFASRTRFAVRQPVVLYVTLADALVFSSHGRALPLGNEEMVAHGAH